MKQYIARLIVAATLAIIAAVPLVAQVGAAGSKVDPNTQLSSAPGKVDPAAILSLASPDVQGEECGTASIPGPANSYDIVFTIHNGIIGEQITNVTIEPFNAFGHKSFVLQSTLNLMPPPGGTLTDLYPGTTADGRGPIVLAATDWDGGEDVSFYTDPDTYTDPSFGATVGEMTGTYVAVAYASSGRRCRGRLVFSASLNASFAVLTQTSPIP